MSALRRRVERLFGQSRIRLPRRRPSAEDLETGDRVQIGAVVWQVRGGLALWSGSWAFLVEALDHGTEVPGAPRTARLLVPNAPAWCSKPAKRPDSRGARFPARTPVLVRGAHPTAAFCAKLSPAH
ncbi:MAG TPA: hypothetical protein VH988_14145 [Thermoanaerobaculia bacterium]|nr:hypothetical protein [Thermoanaerobaculia bacterium]